jgi:CrcB protein
LRHNWAVVWVAIAVGGALGSMARHGVNVLVHGRWPTMKFPLATAIVNVAGCLVIGVLAGLIMSGRITPRLYWREFVFVGILGGFTTFSTFGLDTVTLARTHSMPGAVWNVIAQVALGLLAVQLGILLSSK